MRKKYSRRVIIATVLWTVSFVTMFVGVVWRWELWRDVGLQAALAAGCASLAVTAQRTSQTIVNVIALYRHDRPVDSVHARRAEQMLSDVGLDGTSPDGQGPPPSDGSGPLGRLFERD